MSQKNAPKIDSAEERWILGKPVPGRDGPIGNFRNVLGAIVNYGPFSMIVAFLIIFNALVLGVQTLNLDPHVQASLDVVDRVILYVFTMEFSFQLVYLGLAFFQNGWLIWDGLLVLLTWVFINSENNALRSLRVFRLYAIVSRIPSLQNLALSVYGTIPKIATIWAALFVIFYTWCVLYTTLYSNLYAEGYLDYDYFGRLDKTFMTLFQIMTLDSWTGVVRQVLDARPWAFIGFVAWVIITTFFFLNLILATLTESLVRFSELETNRVTRRLIEQNENTTARQADELLRETRQVSQLQQELIKDQLDSQKALQETLKFVRKRANVMRRKAA